MLQSDIQEEEDTSPKIATIIESLKSPEDNTGIIQDHRKIAHAAMSILHELIDAGYKTENQVTQAITNGEISDAILKNILLIKENTKDTLFPQSIIVEMEEKMITK